jgi:hypothetical protein
VDRHWLRGLADVKAAQLWTGSSGKIHDDFPIAASIGFSIGKFDETNI